MSARRATGDENRRTFAHEQAKQFNSTLLHTAVHRGIVDDAQLARLAEAVIATANASTARKRAFGADADAVGNVDRSKIGLAWTAAVRANEVVAEVCAQFIREGRDRLGEDDTDAHRAAREEARRWLQMHLDAAERAGVLREVTGGA